MARPESHQSSRRKLSLVGQKAYAVTLPINEVRRLKWQKGDELIVRRMKNYIIIQKDSKASHQEDTEKA